MKILLAEDDDDMRRFLVKALEKAGYQVAASGTSNAGTPIQCAANKFLTAPSSSGNSGDLDSAGMSSVSVMVLILAALMAILM